MVRGGVVGAQMGPPVHRGYDPDDEQVHNVRAAQRRPANERWALEAVQAVKATPFTLRRPATAGGLDEPQVIPPVEQADEIPSPLPPGRAPPRVFIEGADLQQYGYAANCPRCIRMRAGPPCRGAKHREACRQRVENHSGDASDPRIVATDGNSGRPGSLPKATPA